MRVTNQRGLLEPGNSLKSEVRSRSNAIARRPRVVRVSLHAKEFRGQRM
jgi:hypothetical protein